jgi:hypothetical protein
MSPQEYRTSRTGEQEMPAGAPAQTVVLGPG